MSTSWGVGAQQRPALAHDAATVRETQTHVLQLGPPVLADRFPEGTP